MKWGEIYRTRDKAAERGGKPGFYVVVSRDFISGHDDISTVICAPVYGEVLGLRTEVLVGTDEGLPRDSAIRCDFLALMFKRRLTGFVGALPAHKQQELRRALVHALQLGD
ncbi:MAG: type II toxin-antitoxin system PemK/MazF family toxin [Vicinamibacterales bacterium]